MHQQTRRARVAGLAVLLGLVTSALSSQDTEVPKPGHYAELNPEAQTKCLQAAVAFHKWVPRLRLRDWRLSLNCGVPPWWKGDSDGLHGVTMIQVTDRAAETWFNPASDKDPELVMIHELTHVVLQEAEALQSNIQDERAVFMLAELIYAGRNNS